MSSIQNLSETILSAQSKAEKQIAIVDNISKNYFDFFAVNASCDLNTEEGKDAFTLLDEYPQIKLMVDILSDYTIGLSQILDDAQIICENIIEKSKTIKQIL